MYFITLDSTLEHISWDVEVPEGIANRADYVMAWRYSEAAATLHQQFHNVPEGRPKWMMLHTVTRRPVATEAAAVEGIAILEYVSGWFKRHYARSRPVRLHRAQEAPDMDELLKSVYLVSAPRNSMTTFFPSA